MAFEPLRVQIFFTKFPIYGLQHQAQRKLRLIKKIGATTIFLHKTHKCVRCVVLGSVEIYKMVQWWW